MKCLVSFFSINFFRRNCKNQNKFQVSHWFTYLLSVLFEIQVGQWARTLDTLWRENWNLSDIETNLVFLSPFDTLLCFKLFFECNLGHLLLSKVAANCKFIDHQLYLTNFKLQFSILVTDACLDTLVHRAGLGFI